LKARKGSQILLYHYIFFPPGLQIPVGNVQTSKRLPNFALSLNFFPPGLQIPVGKNVQGQVRVCRESAALLPSKLSVPHPLPPPHVSLTPPYVQLTGWIRDLLAANQLTLAQIKALRKPLRKPLRVVSAGAAATRGGAPTRVHRVECIIYPVTNYSPAEEEEEKSKRPKVAVSGRLVRQGQGSELVLLSVWGKRKRGGCIFL
jgi:hypothetical protein